jgi:methyl-accepting chemotaxis protein
MLAPLKTSLKKTFSTLFGLQLFFIILLAGLIISLYINQTYLSKSRDTNYESYQLADQLRQSSDDLTRLARTYVVTGNPEFEREYWAVLDIRNGKIPRPLDYDNIYWDFVAVSGEKPRGDGDTVSLHDLMVKEGFTEAEFEKLSLAQKNSDGLVRTEMIAMNAVKGLFQDTEGNFTIKKAPDQEMAIKIMHDENYHKMKAEIMKPIDDFYLMFEERTAEVVNKYLNVAYIIFSLLIVCGILLLLMSIYSFIIVGVQIKEKEKIEKQLADSVNVMEEKVKERTAELELVNTKIKEVLSETQKFNRLMVGRELEMIKLKDEIKS